MARQHLPHPSFRRLALAFSASMALIPATQAANIVVSTVITLSNNPNVGNSFIYSLPATDTLTVTPTGAIVAPPISGGAAIFLGGNVTNQGRLRAAWGSEVQGLFLGGITNVNEAGALIEAHQLGLNSGLTTTHTLTNRGDIRTGAFTLPDGQLLSAVTFPGIGAHIANGAVLNNVRDSLSVVGRWESFSNISVQGQFVNEGEFRSQRNTVTAPAAPVNYTPTLTVQQGFDDTRQATVFNTFFGRMRFDEGTRMLNGGLIANDGLMEIAHGARIDNSWNVGTLIPGLVRGRFENRLGGELLIGSGVWVPASTRALFSNQGELLNDGGRIVVRDGGWFEDRASFINQGGLSRFELQPGGIASFVGYAENSGVMLLQGSTSVQSGGVLVNKGAMSLDAGGILYVDQLGSGLYTHEAGRTTVGGDVLLFGTLQVSGDGSHFNPQAPGLDVLAGGRISVGGAAGQLVVNSAGSLRNAGEISVSDGGTLLGNFGATIENGGLVDVQTGSTLRLEGNWIESFENRATGTLQVGGVVSGGIQSRLSNKGTLTILPGGSLSVPEVLHTGGVLMVDAGATLATPGGQLMMTGGQLGGNGTINGDAFLQGSAPIDPADPSCAQAVPVGVACFTPGASVGHIDIAGHLTLGFGAVLELEGEYDASGSFLSDSVTANSMSFLEGSLIRMLIAAPGSDTAPGSHLLLDSHRVVLLNCLTGPCDFSGASFEVRGGAGGQFTFGADGSLGFEVTPVPEPGTYALLLAGLGVVGFVARRRHTG